MAPSRRRVRICLFGPPGVGKSTLGHRVCEDLGLRFVDLTDVFGTPAAEGSPDWQQVLCAISEIAGDVVEIPWIWQRERQVQLMVRKVGVPLLLWAHPEDMQLRSGRADRLFTPVPRLTIRGGFGRQGTGCREFRQVDRACGDTLMLVDLSLAEATEVFRDCIIELREESTQSVSPTEQEGLEVWVDEWIHDHRANPRVTKVIVDAMARYLAHLRKSGRSPRTLSVIYSDLNAAGQLVLMYDAPKGKRILEYFASPPWEYEYRRKFSDSPNLEARYRRSLEGFAKYLRDSGDLPRDDM